MRIRPTATLRVSRCLGDIALLETKHEVHATIMHLMIQGIALMSRIHSLPRTPIEVLSRILISLASSTVQRSLRRPMSFLSLIETTIPVPTILLIN